MQSRPCCPSDCIACHPTTPERCHHALHNWSVVAIHGGSMRAAITKTSWHHRCGTQAKRSHVPALGTDTVHIGHVQMHWNGKFSETPPLRILGKFQNQPSSRDFANAFEPGPLTIVNVWITPSRSELFLILHSQRKLNPKNYTLK